MPWPRRKLVTILDSGTILGGTGPGGGDILPILDGLGVWYKADDGASSSFAAQFTAANSEYLSILSNTSLRFGNIPWTIGGWFNTLSLPTACVMLNKDPSGANSDYLVGQLSDGRVFIQAYNGTTSPAAIMPSATSLVAWHFVVASFDPAGGGILSIQVDNGAITNSGATGVLVDSAGGLVDLGMNNTAAPTNFWNGSLQNWFIFGRALSVAERAFLWNGGTGRRFEELTASFKTQLRAWWPLDEVSGTRRDVSGNNNTLTDNNTVTQAAGWVRNQPASGGAIQFWNDSGPNDWDLGLSGGPPSAPVWVSNERNGRPVARFDGVNDEMQTVSILGSFLAGATAQTVFAVQKQLSGNTLPVTYSWDSSGTAANELSAHLELAPAIYHITGNTGGGGYTQANTPLPWVDTWHIAELVRDGTTNSSITIEGNPVAIALQAVGSFNAAASAPLRVSGRAYTPGPYVFKGDIAELIIYNRTLTTTERDSVRNYLKAKWGIAQNKLIVSTFAPATMGYVLINTTTNDRLAIT